MGSRVMRKGKGGGKTRHGVALLTSRLWVYSTRVFSLFLCLPVLAILPSLFVGFFDDSRRPEEGD